MATEELIVPTSYITMLLKQVEDRGYDTTDLLKQIGIDPKTLDDTLYHPAKSYGRLYQQAIRVLHDEWFGMLSGGRIRHGSFRLLSLLMVNSRNLRQALLRAWDFGQICRGFKVSIRLEELGPVARVRLAPIEGVSEAEFDTLIRQARPVMIHTTIAAWQRHWSWLIGSELPALRTFYTFSRPDCAWEMAQYSSRDTIFDHTFNGLEFPAQFLDYSIIQNEEALEDFLRTAPFGLIVNEGNRHSTKARIKAILHQNVGHDMLCAERVAKRLHMSVTTLRRHLQLEGTSFQRLKDECRMEAAFHLLACPDLSNREIAERLGFDEVSTFFRAFKKWTGITPGRHRELEALNRH